jgi:hypothetical protein
MTKSRGRAGSTHVFFLVPFQGVKVVTGRLSPTAESFPAHIVQFSCSGFFRRAGKLFFLEVSTNFSFQKRKKKEKKGGSKNVYEFNSSNPNKVRF